MTQLRTHFGDRYTIENELGGGGMSRVFTALEPALGRRVVIKVLKPQLAAGLSSQRFQREIRLAASLQQANIVPVLTAGDFSGLPYYIMPLVDGRSLRERLDKGPPLTLREAIGVLRDVARALSYAHHRGVVHRDIKPENVLLSGAAAVVTDFGIAKALASARADDESRTLERESAVTIAGTVVGTPAYMSPEQIAGDAGIDHRADLYSLGCLGYELFSGVAPFSAASVPALMALHMSATPEPLESRSDRVPAGIAQLVMRCLEKDPAARPATADEVLQVLDETGEVPPTLMLAGRRVRRRGLWAAAAVLALLAVALVAGTRFLGGGPMTVAVIPFRSAGADTGAAYLAEGLADGLATALGKVPRVEVVSRSLAARYKGNATLEPAAVGRELSAGHVLQGSVRRGGNRVVVSAQLARASDNREVWSDVFNRPARDLVLLHDEITQAIVAALGQRFDFAPEQQSSGLAGTTSPEAYDLYLRGRFLLLRRGPGVRQSIEMFEQALAIDSAFAPASASLALALELLPYFEPVPARSVGDRATSAARAALALDASLAEAYTALGLAHAHQYQWREAEAAFRRALELNPKETDAHIQYARFLYYTGRFDDARAGFARARRLDPYSAVASAWYGHLLFQSGDQAEGLAEMRRAVELDSTNPPALVMLGTALSNSGKQEEARALAQRLLRRYPAWRGPAVVVMAMAGDWQRGREFISKMRDSTQLDPNAAIVIAVTSAVMGDSSTAFEALEEATARGDNWPTYYSLAEPQFDPLRRSERFAAIVRSAGLDAAVFTAPLGGRPAPN